MAKRRNERNGMGSKNSAQIDLPGLSREEWHRCQDSERFLDFVEALPGARNVLGFTVIDGGRAGKPCSVYALQKAHAWHRDPNSELGRLCTDKNPPGIDLSIYYGPRRGDEGAA
jgi:hypothetical protein